MGVEGFLGSDTVDLRERVCRDGTEEQRVQWLPRATSSERLASSSVGSSVGRHHQRVDDFTSRRGTQTRNASWCHVPIVERHSTSSRDLVDLVDLIDLIVIIVIITEVRIDARARLSAPRVRTSQRGVTKPLRFHASEWFHVLDRSLGSPRPPRRRVSFGDVV